MTKKVMEDMQSRGVRVTEIYSEKLKMGHYSDRKPSEKIPVTPKIKRSPRKPRTVLMTILVIIIIIGIYFICNLFEKANVDIYEKHSTMTLSHIPFNISSDSNSKIHFELMIVNDQVSKDITLKQTQNISEKAAGVITLYNEYSTKPQTLLVHTFVSDTNGKAYETDQKVTIPGYTLNQAKVVPGKTNVGITAFLSGDTYNDSATDFIINSYKGTEREKKIYGKLSSPISGGAEGLEYVLGPDEKGMLDAYAQSTFKSNLMKKVNAEVPPGYILYSNAMNFTYKVDENALSKSSNAKVNITGTISSVILNQQDLSNAILTNLLPNINIHEFKEIEIPDISKLTFNFIDSNQVITKEMTTLGFTMSGTVNPIWHADINTLRANLKGVDKDKLTTIFQADPGITSAHATIFPLWQSHMPDSEEKIHIEIK